MIAGESGIQVMELLVNETLMGEQRWLEGYYQNLLNFRSGLVLYI